jgi:hypothetical protein
MIMVVKFKIAIKFSIFYIALQIWHFYKKNSSFEFKFTFWNNVSYWLTDNNFKDSKIYFITFQVKLKPIKYFRCLSAVRFYEMRISYIYDQLRVYEDPLCNENW